MKLYGRPGRETTPLAMRLSREIIGAIIAMVFLIAAATLGAMAVHLYRDAVHDDRTIYTNLVQLPESLLRTSITSYNRSTDPEIWVYRGSRVIAQSPNAAGAPGQSGRSGIMWGPSPVLRWVGRHGAATFMIDWPLDADIAVLQGLMLVIAGIVVVGTGIGLVIARWTSRRALKPMKTMTDSVNRMLVSQSIQLMPKPFGDKEFADLASLINDLLSSLRERWEQDRALLAEAAHQLRTPLEVIRGNLDIVQTWEDIDVATRDECLMVIDRTVTDMTHLVGDLLTLEQATNAGSTPLKPLLLSDLVREIGEDAHALSRVYPGVRIDWEVPHPWTQAHVLGDEVFARRALWAVTENALKYAAPAGGVVRLTICPHSASSEFVGVCIRDNGPGIPAADLPHVFTRFYRGSDMRHIRGSGLGLTMARTLMSAQRGDINIDASSRGTTVTLWFRITEAEIQPAGA